MKSKCSKCEKRFLTKRKVMKHHGLYHELEVQWMWETFFNKQEIQQTSWAVSWTWSVVYVRNVFWRKGYSTNIMGCTMTTKCSKCEKRFWRKGKWWSIMGCTMNSKCSKCEKYFLMKKISSDIMFPSMNSMCSLCEKVFWRKGYSTNIMGCTMNSKCSECEKRFLKKRKFNKHYVPYHTAK